MNEIQAAVAVFDKLADVYQDKYMDVSLYHHSFDLFCDQITQKNAEILELACGPGNITQYLLKKRPDFKILGTDLAPNMIELAKINNPTAEFQVMDCMDIGQLDQKYDAIMCGFCLPYLSREESVQLISDAGKILKPNGVLYLSTMEDNYSKSGPKTSSDGAYQLYMYFHQADYLAAVLQENGFKIINLQRQDYPTQDGTKTVDLLILAAKNHVLQ
ncbi:MAG: class I SAM-dependent methyltransferase [Saprospiraceae bacterium]